MQIWSLHFPNYNLSVAYLGALDERQTSPPDMSDEPGQQGTPSMPSRLMYMLWGRFTGHMQETQTLTHSPRINFRVIFLWQLSLLQVMFLSLSPPRLSAFTTQGSWWVLSWVSPSILIAAILGPPSHRAWGQEPSEVRPGYSGRQLLSLAGMAQAPLSRGWKNGKQKQDSKKMLQGEEAALCGSQWTIQDEAQTCLVLAVLTLTSGWREAEPPPYLYHGSLSRMKARTNQYRQ